MPKWRWSALILLLALEIVSITIRFDTVSLTHVDTGWASLLNHASLIGQLGIAVVVALVIFGGQQWNRRLVQISRQLELTPFPWLFVVAHLTAFAAFYLLTAVVIEGDLQSRLYPIVWLASWAVVGVTCLTFWVLAAFPPAVWSSFGAPSVSVLVVPLLVALGGLGLGQVAEQAWRPLANCTFSIVQSLLSVLYSPVIAEPSSLVIGTKSFSVQLAPECSGYEGMGLIAVFVGAFLWWYRRDLRFPQAFALLFVGVLAAWLANALRITALIAIGSSLSRSVALGGFHSQAGWLTFNLIALAVIAIAWNSPLFSKNAAWRGSTSGSAEYPAAPFLVPFLVLLAAAMFTGAFSAGAFDRLYPVRVLLTAATFAYFFRAYQRLGILRWSWSWQPLAIGAAVFCLWILLEPLAPVVAAQRQAYADSLASMPPALAAIWIAGRAIGSVLVVPVVEELAFRGYLTRRLIAQDFDRLPIGAFSWFSFLVSSLAFGLLHGRWLAGSIAGMLFGAALYRRGRLTDAMLAHATANALVTCYVLATRNWTAWS